MSPKSWNRREVLQRSARAAIGSALATLADSCRRAHSPARLQPLEDERFAFIVTTERNPWQKAQVFKPAFSWTMLNLNVDLPEKQDLNRASIQGFGACFNELGWTSLQQLSSDDRQSVLRELFDPVVGARFSYCRMPIGANDFSTEAYSYDEQDGDFALQHFSIDHDRRTLIPFIHAAQQYQPRLRLWASPWTPPSWMKRNHFYAEAKGGQKDNGIRPDQIGHEGEDMFVQEPRYLEAYARYFGSFIDAYRAEGIRVGMVMPQNEFNSAQNFPSCTWTPEGLVRFLRYLGPEMSKRDVELFLGTIERGNPKLVETVMADKDAAQYVKGLGIQWAGKNALPALHSEFPQLLVFQSEQECGDGKNAWSYAGYTWQLMKHYLRSGAGGYMYWNISLLQGQPSTWGWPQKSLVTVDRAANSFKYTHDYFVFKHLTHFVDVGAILLQTSGTCDDALGFRNPDGTLVLLVRNELAHSQQVQIQAGEREAVIELPPDSVGTVTIGTA